MRNYSEYEKSVLKYIITQNENFNLYRLIKSSIVDKNDELFFWDENDKDDSEFGFYENDLCTSSKGNGKTMSTHNEIKKKIIAIIFLLKYMENNYLIGLHKTAAMHFYDENIQRIKEIEENADSIYSLFYEHEYLVFIRKNLHSSFYITDECRFIINNNFKTQEQIYIEQQLEESKTQTISAKRTMYISLAALGAAIIVIVISIIPK